jgi:hypothetical protein
MKKTIRLLLASLLAIGAFVGCDGEVGPKEPVVVTTAGEVTMDSSAIQNGIIAEPITTLDTKTNVAMTIPGSTTLTFKDDDTEVTTAPTTKTEVKQSTEKATTTINFEAEGRKVIPSNPVIVSVPAPAGSKAGDTVQIEVPDDGSITQKLIFVIVKADGTVDVTILPKAFEKTIIIVVKVKVDNSTN